MSRTLKEVRENLLEAAEASKLIYNILEQRQQRTTTLKVEDISLLKL